MKQRYEYIQELIALRDIRKAESEIAKQLRVEHDDDYRADLLLKRAQVRLLASRPDDALEDLNEVKTSRPNWFVQPHHIELLADCHLARFEMAAPGFAEKLDVRESRGLYQRIMDDYPTYANLGWVLYQLGRICLIEDQAYVAEKYFHKALFSPSTVHALTAYSYERLGFIAHYESRDPHAAWTFLDKAIDTYPKDESTLWLVQVYVLKSRVLKDSEAERAIQSARKALAITNDYPNNKELAAEVLFTLAEMLYQRAGYEQELVEIIQKFMKTSKIPLGVDVTWSRAYEMLGDAYCSLAKYEQAILAYTNALQSNPYHPWEESLRYRIARVHYQQKQYTESYQQLVLAIKEASSDYRLYNLLGNTLFALADYAQAAKIYEIGMRFAPQGADFDNMLTYYELARQLHPPL